MAAHRSHDRGINGERLIAASFELRVNHVAKFLPAAGHTHHRNTFAFHKIINRLFHILAPD